MINPRIYTEAELHLMPFCFGPRERVTYTEAEVERWLLLRAIEWEAWPEFVSQLVIPIALLRFPVLPVLVVLALVDLSWRFVVTHLISMTLVRMGPIVTFLKWPSAIVCACVLAYSHRFGIAALALVWPLVGGVFITLLSDFLSKRLGLCEIGDVERALAVRIGYPACRPLRIVSLDDEPFMGEALKMMLQFDFPDSQVLTYTDAELALQELEQEDPDLFITDWNHPGRLHGDGLLQVLASKGARYPVVVASAYAASIASQNVLDQFLDLGLKVTLLPKPFLIEDLRKHYPRCPEYEPKSKCE
jgi:CheY-like chemotaxis protein